SYAVSVRRTEIGLRMAIGASEQAVQRMILGQAAMLGVGGGVVGLAVSGVARKLTAGTLPDLSIDPLVMAATSGVLFVIVLMAAWLPARRASRIDPAVALKAQ